MGRNPFFTIAVILVVGLFLAVLLLPGGAFAQDTDTGSGSGVTVYGMHHDQMHATAGQPGAGQMGQSMMGADHMAHHANMTGPMTGTMAGMHAGMMGSGMGHMMGHRMDTDAEHQQHMAAGTCPLADEDAAEHAAACPYQPSTTTGD